MARDSRDPMADRLRGDRGEVAGRSMQMRNRIGDVIAWLRAVRRMYDYELLRVSDGKI